MPKQIQTYHALFAIIKITCRMEMNINELLDKHLFRLRQSQTKNLNLTNVNFKFQKRLTIIIILKLFYLLHDG